MEDYPKTLGEFEARFSSEGACREYLLQLRWPQGVSCPRCECREVWETIRALLVCASCSYHISVTAGTIFERTRKPLTIWFRTMWWVSSQKTGVSALGLQQVLGLGSYHTAWTWLHKLRRAMVRPGRDRLSGTLEVDETYVGGAKPGKRGRGESGKSLVVIATEIEGPHMGRIRLARVPAGCLFPKPGKGATANRAPRRGDSHRRVERLWETEFPWVHPRSGAPCGRGRRGFAATLPSSRLVAQAVDDWHASRNPQSRAPGLLPRRIYVPIQSPNEPPPWQAILQISPISGGDRTDALQGHGQKRKGPQAPQIRHIVAT